MSKRLIWVEGDDFTGWCCPDCPWGMTAPRLESTVAALAFNRLAEETFEKHKCARARTLHARPRLSSLAIPS